MLTFLAVLLVVTLGAWLLVHFMRGVLEGLDASWCEFCE